MATYTDNYNLEKPAQSDPYNVDVFNENADKIDEALGDKAENQSLAPIESSSTASRNYSVGQQFVYNGLLYEATAAIASGGTISPGTNCARTTVAEELSALNDSLNNLFTDYSMSQNITVAANGSNYISIPISSAPSGTRFFVPFYLASGNNNVLLQQFSIDGSGTFTVYFRNISSQSVTSMATVRIRCIKIA